MKECAAGTIGQFRENIIGLSSGSLIGLRQVSRRDGGNVTLVAYIPARYDREQAAHIDGVHNDVGVDGAVENFVLVGPGVASQQEPGRNQDQVPVTGHDGELAHYIPQRSQAE